MKAGFFSLISYTERLLKQQTNAVSHWTSQKSEKRKEKSPSMRTGETDVISVQKDAGRIAVLAHM